MIVNKIAHMLADMGLKGLNVPTNEQYVKVERALALSLSIDEVSTIDMIIDPSKEFVDSLNELRRLLKDLGIKN